MLDTIAQYPNDPTLGKLTFMIDLKNQQKDLNVADFNGVGKSKLTMSLGYKDGNYPSESQVPIYTSQDVTAKYAVKLRLKGELLVSGDEWMIDYVYAQLASEKAKFYEQYKEAKEELLKLKTAKQNVASFFREEEPAQQER